MVALLQVERDNFHYPMSGDNGWWMGASLRQMGGLVHAAGVVLMVRCRGGVDEFKKWWCGVEVVSTNSGHGALYFSGS